MHCGSPNASNLTVYKMQVQLVFILRQVFLILYGVLTYVLYMRCCIQRWMLFIFCY